VTEKKENKNSMKGKSCFVIMPISQQAGYEVCHFDLVYEDIIKPSIEATGMVPIRADETTNTNLIQLDILKKVIGSDMAICDMSAKNPNVFYELGVRQAFDKPTVLMTDNITSAPFDVSSLRYVEYQEKMNYRDVKSVVERLTQALIETYEKQYDKSEINSLIRLMELTAPAQLNSIDITDEDRTALQIKELSTAVNHMQVTQNKMLSLLSNDIARYKSNATYDSIESIIDSVSPYDPIGNVKIRSSGLRGDNSLHNQLKVYRKNAAMLANGITGGD
jgi:hypothetical protein